MADEKRDDCPELMGEVSAEMVKAIKGAGLTEDAVSEVIRVALRGAVDRGADLGAAAKAIIMGVIRGGGTKGETALRMLTHAANTIIHHTADRGGNLAAATKGLVLGAIASAKPMEVEVDKAASTAARGSVEGASAAGSVTLEQVIRALKEPIGGRVVVPAPPLQRV
jgi:hypothetical protein